MSDKRRAELDEFYGLISVLERRCGGRRTLAASAGSSSWPRRGVYFFFEHGELREDGVTPRVVRVGTHGLRPSKSTLWKRLSQHKGSPGGSLAGGGNHRGSIFRLHVGMALLASGEWPEDVRSSWGVDQSASAEVRRMEYGLERAVTEYIGAMPFLWASVDDEPSAQSDRGAIEAGAIALLSNANRPAIDAPSATWLGHRSARPAIRDSGLWNVNHVEERPTGRFLAVLERHIGA